MHRRVFESGHSGMMQAQSGDNRWQHLQPSHTQSLCESGAFHPPPPSSSFLFFFFCPSWCLHTETLKRSVCGFACDSLMFNSPGRSQTDSGTHSVHVCAKTQHREAEHKDEGAQ